MNHDLTFSLFDLKAHLLEDNLLMRKVFEKLRSV